MDVFVFCIGWDYEGESVRGVYASIADAIAAAERDKSYCDERCVYQCTVGSDYEPVEVWPPRKPQKRA